MKVPFLNLNRLHNSIRSEILEAVAEVVDSGEFILGSKVEQFEENFARYCGTTHAVGVNTGTSALHLAILACEIGQGDEVITVASTFVATAAAITYAGACPIFVDIDESTWTLDPKKIEEAITPRTKAIIPVHLHGRLANMDEISKIARDYDLRIIEDACQAHGAERHGLRAGQYGHLAAFSFYPGKNLGALGEGGAIVGNDPALVERVRLLRNWGSRVRYQHEVLAYNYRMDGIQGAVLDVKLRFLEEWTEGRRRVAALYDQAFDELGICRPQADSGRHVYHIYAIRVPDRSLVQHVLDEKGVQHAIHYPIPVHLQPAFSHIQVPRAHLPVSEKVADEWVSLPMDPLLTESEIDYVIESVTQAVS